MFALIAAGKGDGQQLCVDSDSKLEGKTQGTTTDTDTDTDGLEHTCRYYLQQIADSLKTAQACATDEANCDDNKMAHEFVSVYREEMQAAAAGRNSETVRKLLYLRYIPKVIEKSSRLVAFHKAFAPVLATLGFQQRFDDDHEGFVFPSPYVMCYDNQPHLVELRVDMRKQMMMRCMTHGSGPFDATTIEMIGYGTIDLFSDDQGGYVLKTKSPVRGIRDLVLPEKMMTAMLAEQGETKTMAYIAKNMAWMKEVLFLSLQ